MSIKWIPAFLLMQMACCYSSGSCGKVLAWATDYSHWINMKTILDELIQRGHEVTVLTWSGSVFIEPQNSSGIQYEVFMTSYNRKDFEDLMTKWIDQWIYDFPKETFWTYNSLMQKFFSEISDMFASVCRQLALNKNLLAKLQQSRFEVLLADPVSLCGELVAELLKIPFVFTVRFTLGYTYEKYGGGLLFPPSYVPVIMSELSDHMTFMERVKNMIYVLYFDFWFETYNTKKWNQLYSEILGRPTTLLEMLGKADIWLIRTYWDLEFPRPLLPNTDFVGGLHCKPAKPLPKEMEEFVQSSGEDGIAVFSLGSVVKNMTEEKANMIASALAKIPQKVIWRFDGKKPATLGPNTRLYEWIPQNDLLGHPKTKVFITHGGANGIYEAIYHGIPMVAIPLFADQPHNIAVMKAKGAALRLDFHTFSSTDLLNALETAIYDPSYKENVMKLSRIHHDQPMKPLDRAVFWIEFVMRHKGAKHLRVAAHDLSWFQYHSLDVIGFLLACVTSVMFIITKCCLFCCRNFAKDRKKTKRE
ncbi:UDP-glucuronosyltransferase 2B17-like [Ctenodactylus gundi]